MASNSDIVELQRRLGVTMRRPELLEQALTHRSLAHAEPSASYDRLEFLGDAVVSAVVAEELYRRFPAMQEGELSERKSYLVSGDTLARAARAIGLDEIARLRQVLEGLSDRGAGAVLADAFEAVVGAVFLDRGFRVARRVVNRALQDVYRYAGSQRNTANAKSVLQELTQARWRVLPVYDVARDRGPDHEPVFVARVLIDGAEVGTGYGSSKKTAEQAAAAAALENLLGEEKHDKGTC